MKAQPTTPTVEALIRKIERLEERNEILMQCINDKEETINILRKNFQLANSLKEDYKSVIMSNPIYKTQWHAAAANRQPLNTCKILSLF